jgi:predicted Zn finger-like uncharacterized protein
MILDCPACGARYRLPDDAIPPEGKAVRCARCKHSWVELGTPFAEEVLPLATISPVMADAILPSDAAPEASAIPAETSWEADAPALRRRRWLWLVPLLLLIALALGAAAVLTRVVVLPAPLASRLNLPALTLPAIALPAIELPPLDLTRVPYAGPWLDHRLHPPARPPVLLTLQADAGFHQLNNGSRMLALTGSVVNPTGSQQAVPEIEALVLDAARRPVYRWRIPAPLVALPPRTRAPFDSSATGYPASAATVTLRFVREP